MPKMVYTVVILLIASWSIDNCLSAVITTSHPPLPCQLRSGISSSTMRKSYLVHPLKQKSETSPIWREPLRNNILNWMSWLLIWSFGGARNLCCCPPNPGKCYNNAFLKLTSSKRNKSLSLLAVQKLQILSLVKRRCCWSELLVRSLVLKCVPCPYHSFPLYRYISKNWGETIQLLHRGTVGHAGLGQTQQSQHLVNLPTVATWPRTEDIGWLPTTRPEHPAPCPLI